MLVTQIGLPDGTDSFFLLVVHTKSRLGGRASTDDRRAGAAQQLLAVLEHDFDGEKVVLLGDFNDNPDDRALNILETGDPSAPAAMEEDPGAFMRNLTEALAAGDHVSHGRNTRDLLPPDRVFINTVDPGSRERNYTHRHDDSHTGDILFDNILVSIPMARHYVLDSVRVFDHRSGVQGNSNTRASDHLPVYADFLLGRDDDDSEASGIRIIALLPNPAGADAGNETITLLNPGDAAISLDGWAFRDRANNVFTIPSQSIPAGGSTVVSLTTNSMPLNNGGDRIELLDSFGVTVDSVTYRANQVTEGLPITVAQ